MRTRIGYLALVLAAALVLVTAMSLAAPRGAPAGIEVSAAAAVTPTGNYTSFLPIVAKNWYKVGAGWVQFGQKSPPLEFEWSSSGVLTQACASVPPALLWDFQAFAVYKFQNGTWLVYSENAGVAPHPFDPSPNLVAVRCEDGARYVLASNITDQGASLFSRYGEDWLAVGHWEPFSLTSTPSLYGRIVPFRDGVGYVFSAQGVTPRKIDDIRGNLYAAYGEEHQVCYERGTLNPAATTWEHCFDYPRGQQAAQKVQVPQSPGSADSGRQYTAVSPSGRFVFMNWIPVTPTQNFSAWGCSIWDTQLETEVIRINTDYQAGNPCYGENDWLLTPSGHEQFWFQAYWSPLTGLNIFDATDRRWVVQKRSFFGTGMVLSSDGSRAYTTSGPGAIIVAHDTANLSRTWTTTLYPINSSDVLPTH